MSRLRASLPLALVWAFGFAALGLYLPYYALYLNEDAGLSGAQVGIVLAIVPGVGVLAHAFWGRIADRTGRRAGVTAAIALGCAAGFVTIGVQSSFAGFALATALLALFLPAFGPQALSLCMAVLDEPGSHRLGRVRVWGTLGFAASALALPWALRVWEAGGSGLGVILPAAAVPMTLAAAMALVVPERVAPRHERSHRGEWRQLAVDPGFQRAMVFTFVIYLALQGPMHLFPLLVRHHGGGVDAIARMWFWMLLLEVPLVFALGRSAGWAGPRALVAIGAGAAAVRWLVSGYTEDLDVLTVVQVLHGVTVWGVMLGLPLYVDSLVPARLRSTAQGWHAMVGPALGGVVSNALAGAAIDRYGGDLPARAGGWLALGCALLVPVLLPRPRSAVEPDGAPSPGEPAPRRPAA